MCHYDWSTLPFCTITVYYVNSIMAINIVYSSTLAKGERIRGKLRYRVRDLLDETSGLSNNKLIRGEQFIQQSSSLFFQHKPWSLGLSV